MSQSKKFTFVKTHPTQQDRDSAEELLDLFIDAVEQNQPPFVKFSGVPLKRPSLLFAVFDLVLQVYSEIQADEADDDELDAAMMLLGVLLHELRLAIENGEPKAVTVWERLQIHIAERVFTEDFRDGALLSYLANILQESGLTPGEELLERIHALMEEAGDEQMDGELSLDAFDEMLDELTEIAEDSPFMLVETVLAQFNMMPVEAQIFIFARMTAHANTQLNDLGFMMLLHPNAEVRTGLAQTLGLAEVGAKIAPVTLRRLIGLRNWLPEAERAPVDALIKKARSEGVACAPRPDKPKGVKYLGSGLDGAGAMMVWAQYNVQRKKGLVGMLAKQGFGLRDFLSYPAVSKKEIDLMLEQLDFDVGMEAVDPRLLDYLVPHFLAVGLAQGNPPPPGLLLFAEQLGHEYWPPHRYEVPALVAELVPDSSPEAVQRALAHSDEWLEESYTDSWFEGGEAFRDHLKESLGGNWRRKSKQCPRLILDDILQPKRKLWSERLLFTGLWMKFWKENRSALWQDFVLVARELADADRPLDQIPLMPALAEISFTIAKHEDD